MSLDLNAIDTEYKGYYFRSRIEAKWAVFFDALGWKWDYEIEGFSLPSGAYLPDFYFPDLNVWAEVKYRELSANEMSRCCELSERMNKSKFGVDIIILVGSPSFRNYKTISGGILSEEVVMMPINDRFYPFYTSKFSKFYCGGVEDAIIKARSSRFEFEWKEV